jgi:hypothetical protein
LSTSSWSNVRFNHSGVAGACSNCHNGSTATGKPSGHVQTNAQCDDCHTSTASWSSVSFDHSGVSGNCSSCHNGSTATGKSSGHFVTTQQCDSCHRTSGWLPTTKYNHLSGNYPGDHRANPGCTDCHASNSQTATWSFASYKPDCAGCHANDYDQAEHRGTVSQYRDCSGSRCHSVSDSDWD